MLSKAQIKHIRSLSQQKYRNAEKLFIAEGDKIAREWLHSSYSIKLVVALQSWVASHLEALEHHPEAEVVIVSEDELTRVSQLHTPNKVLLVVHALQEQAAPPGNEWTIVLDGLQDPGNMGSIIRIADWFGIGHIVSAPNTVDAYHPKVIQAAMGSHLRVKFYETDLSEYLASLQMPVLAATLEGENIYEAKQFPAAALIIGNEGKGIGEKIINLASHRVTIPRIGGAESLNAAVSTGILCALLKSG